MTRASTAARWAAGVALSTTVALASVFGAIHYGDWIPSSDPRMSDSQVISEIEKSQRAVMTVVDAVTGTGPVIVQRTDSLRCALMYLAAAFGKGRMLSSGQWSLRGLPAATPWRGFPDDWRECALCDAGYACNVGPRRGGRR